MSNSHDIYNLLVNLYIYQTIHDIYMSGGEIDDLESRYRYPLYHFATKKIPWKCKIELYEHEDVDYIRFGPRKSKIKLKNGVEGCFSYIKRNFKLHHSFQPGHCYYACENIVEQCRANNQPFEFLIIRLYQKPDKTHAVIRMKLDNFEKPVIIDPAFSLIVEEPLFFEVYKTEILKKYTDEELGEFGIRIDGQTNEQALYFKNK